jgi:hypothetical protein
LLEKLPESVARCVAAPGQLRVKGSIEDIVRVISEEYAPGDSEFLTVRVKPRVAV